MKFESGAPRILPIDTIAAKRKFSDLKHVRRVVRAARLRGPLPPRIASEGKRSGSSFGEIGESRLDDGGRAADIQER